MFLGTGNYNSRNNGRTYENGGSSYNRRDHQYQQYDSSNRFNNGYSNSNESGGQGRSSSPNLNGGVGRQNHNTNHQQQQQRYTTNNYNHNSHNGTGDRNSSLERPPRFDKSRDGAADSSGRGYQYQVSF